MANEERSATVALMGKKVAGDRWWGWEESGAACKW